MSRGEQQLRWLEDQRRKLEAEARQRKLRREEKEKRRQRRRREEGERPVRRQTFLPNIPGKRGVGNQGIGSRAVGHEGAINAGPDD